MHPEEHLTLVVSSQILPRDDRYAIEAYLFVARALDFGQRRLLDESEEDEPRHLTGQQLCDAVRLLAWRQYGLLAKTVLNSWGLRQTEDFGEVVFNLIDAGELRKSESDSRDDFVGVYDFEAALVDEYRIGDHVES